MRNAANWLYTLETNLDEHVHKLKKLNRSQLRPADDRIEDLTAFDVKRSRTRRGFYMISPTRRRRSSAAYHPGSIFLATFS
jgi:hypothetical protein